MKIKLLLSITIFLFSVPMLTFADSNVVDKTTIEATGDVTEPGKVYGLDPETLVDGKFSYDNGWDNQKYQSRKVYADLTFSEQQEISQINIGLSSGLLSYQPRAGFDVYVSSDGINFRRAFGMDSQYLTVIENNTIRVSIKFKKQTVKAVRLQYRGDGKRGRITEIDFLKEQSDTMEPYASMIDAYDYIDAELTDIEPPGEVTNVNATPIENTIELNYSLPSDEDFSNVNIYVNGQVHESNEKKFLIDGLEPGKTYDIIITTVDHSGNESAGVTVSATTGGYVEPVPQEVENLEVKAKHDRVDLYWDNPDTQYFEMAKIYRKEIEERKSSFNINPFAATVVHADGYEPIFETNGTFFADLTIEEQTDYEYKVTTTYQGLESNGITIQTTVPKEPIINLDELETPFSVTDLIKSGNGLLLLVGPFVLLALAFILVPKLRDMIINSFRSPVGKNPRGERQVRQMSTQPRQQRQARQISTQPRQQRQPRETRV